MKTIVMTGGTSGFGAITARRIAAQPDTRLLLGARGRRPEGIETLSLDLSSLTSVRSFAAAVIERLDGDIDAIVLNAGTIGRDLTNRTPDGLETTFVVNHLAQHLLLRLLLDRLTPGATVVVTSSGTHDPAEKASLPPPRHANAYVLAQPEREREPDRKPATAARRAYTASKLCNILTVRALAIEPEAQALRLNGVAYCPGQTPGTGLMRNMPIPLRAGWRLLGGPLRGLAPQFNRRDVAGLSLAELALGNVRAPIGQSYAALRRNKLTWLQPSVLACRDDLAHTLWHDGIALTQQRPAG